MSEEAVKISWTKHLIGLALAIGAVALAYWVYTQIPMMLRATPQPWRGIATENRLVLEVLAAFLGLSILDWLWRKTLGR